MLNGDPLTRMTLCPERSSFSVDPHGLRLLYLCALRAEPTQDLFPR